MFGLQALLAPKFFWTSFFSNEYTKEIAFMTRIMGIFLTAFTYLLWNADTETAHMVNMIVNPLISFFGPYMAEKTLDCLPLHKFPCVALPTVTALTAASHF